MLCFLNSLQTATLSHFANYTLLICTLGGQGVITQKGSSFLIWFTKDKSKRKLFSPGNSARVSLQMEGVKNTSVII